MTLAEALDEGRVVLTNESGRPRAVEATTDGVWSWSVSPKLLESRPSQTVTKVVPPSPPAEDPILADVRHASWEAALDLVRGLRDKQRARAVAVLGQRFELDPWMVEEAIEETHKG